MRTATTAEESGGARAAGPNKAREGRDGVMHTPQTTLHTHTHTHTRTHTHNRVERGVASGAQQLERRRAAVQELRGRTRRVKTEMDSCKAEREALCAEREAAAEGVCMCVRACVPRCLCTCVHVGSLMHT